MSGCLESNWSPECAKVDFFSYLCMLSFLFFVFVFGLMKILKTKSKFSTGNIFASPAVR